MPQSMDEQPPAIFIGRYRDGGGPLQQLTPSAGGWQARDAGARIDNASFAAYSPRHDLHYIVDEAAGRLGAYRYGAEGWSRLADVSTGGHAPCFVSLDEAGEALAVANYESGDVAFWWLDPVSGLPDGPALLLAGFGEGPDRERQAGPHAHCVRFQGDRLYRTDLGADRVLLHAIDRGARSVAPAAVAWQAPPGQGPRHILFHPVLPRAYVLTELGSSVFVAEVEADGGLRVVQQLSTLPAGFEGRSLGGHIALSQDAAQLYVSNRGHDSLAVFTVTGDGALEPLQWAPTHGRSPRHFHLIPARGQCVVAHEEGGGVSILELTPDGWIGGLQQSIPAAKAAFVGALGG